MSKISPDLLAKYLAGVQSGSLTIEECLSSNPALAEELRPLLETALSIRPVPPMELDPGFRARTRVALIEAISAENKAATKLSLARLLGLGGGKLQGQWATLAPTRLRTSATIAAVACMFAIAVGGGASYAAQGTLPGDALYPLKITVEVLQASLAVDDEARARSNAESAARRLDETERALQSGRPDAAQQAADQYSQYVALADQHLSQAAASGKDVSDLADTLSDQLARQQAKLSEVEKSAPEAAKGALVNAAREAEKGLTTAVTIAESAHSKTGKQELSPAVGNNETPEDGPRSAAPDADDDSKGTLGSRGTQVPQPSPRASEPAPAARPERTSRPGNEGQPTPAPLATPGTGDSRGRVQPRPDETDREGSPTPVTSPAPTKTASPLPTRSASPVPTQVSSPAPTRVASPVPTQTVRSSLPEKEDSEERQETRRTSTPAPSADPTSVTPSPTSRASTATPVAGTPSTGTPRSGTPSSGTPTTATPTTGTPLSRPSTRSEDGDDRPVLVASPTQAIPTAAAPTRVPPSPTTAPIPTGTQPARPTAERRTDSVRRPSAALFPQQSNSRGWQKAN